MTTLAGLPIIEGYPGNPMIDYESVKFNGLRGEVTLDDIKYGIRQDCKNCPVARAVGRMFPDCRVYADSFSIVISRSCLAYGRKFVVSKALGKWIGEYDSMGKCEPIELELQDQKKHFPYETLEIVSGGTD